MISCRVLYILKILTFCFAGNISNLNYPPTFAVGTVTKEMIEQYIEHHFEPKIDDSFQVE